ncbi:hypothetical protein FQN57_006591 [Myotisia sp. PD_48]|nr:hypothetical protein FQN57_006591 [Myotisia sp. PD_48]
MRNQKHDIKILDVEIDADQTYQSFLRLLANGQSIKYITIEPGIYNPEDMSFGPTLQTFFLIFRMGIGTMGWWLEMEKMVEHTLRILLGPNSLELRIPGMETSLTT